MALTRINQAQVFNDEWKQPVNVATTADVGNLYLGNTQPNTVDGVSTFNGMRILVKNQTTGSQNGIWDVVTPGSGSNGWWIRTTDASSNLFIKSGMTVVSTQGNTYAGQEFRLTTADPIVLNNTSLTFQLVSGIPGGGNTQVQFNDTGFLSGTTAFTYNKVSNVVTVSGNLTVGNVYNQGSETILGQLSVGSTITVTGNILPSANVTYNLGSPTQKFKSAYFSGNTVYIGSESMGVDPSGTWQFSSNGSTVTLGANATFNPPSINVTGNVSSAIDNTGLLNSSGNVLANTVSAYALSGLITTAGQTNITSIGNLTSLSVGGTSTFYSAPIITPTTNATTLGTGALIVQGGASFAKDVYIGGNLYAANVVSINYSYLTVNDPLIYLQGNVYPYNFSIGFYGHFIGGPANTYAHTGFVRSWTNNAWYLFSNIAEPIAGNVNVSDGNIIYDPIYTGSHTVVGFINANGNVSASTVNAGQINTTGNVLATNAVLNALTVNGVINASGNILAGFGVFNGLTTNNGLTVNGGWINNAGNIVATGGIFNSLTVNGLITQGITTANTATAIFTHGNDTNFQLTAQNGVLSNATGSEVARFGINYNTAGWDSFTQYVRGASSQNGYLSFWAANAPIANVQSTGLTVTGVINASGNILSTGAVHNTLTVNGTASTNVASVASTILAGAVGVTGNIIANASVIYGNTSGGYGVRQFFNPITNSLDTVFG